VLVVTGLVVTGLLAVERQGRCGRRARVGGLAVMLRLGRPDWYSLEPSAVVVVPLP